MARRLEGRRRKRGKWQAYVDTPAGQITKTFAIDTPHEEIDAWRAEQAGKHPGPVAVPDSFAADVQTYLSRVAAKATINQIAAHLELWLDALGRQRSRRSITATEIDRVLQGWLKDPPPARPEGSRGRRPKGDRLSLETVRKRRTSLKSFFDKMNGAGGTNPVDDTSLPAPAALGAPRSIDVAAVECALACMTDDRSVKRGADPEPSRAKIIARVMAYTGIPPAMLKKIRATDFAWTAGTIRLEARRKTGVEARTLTLLPDALAAFRAFHAVDLYGHDFAVQSVNRAFQKGVRQAGGDPAVTSLYALRHSFLTWLYATTGDEATVARFAMHAPGSPITSRYTLGAHDAVNRAATAALQRTLIEARRQALKPAPKINNLQARRKPILPANPARRRKVG
jgi:integrase